ncbi:TetR family transcriptional regulator [Myxococcota bacterium]|nr:TetR family transcriptional regulator [Myxococcota bacterium]MBU1899590.1 TetR family transcriptional regulator [Myxococcota bacterium]
MGRLAGTKPEETRERILEAATRVFADRGFGGARVRQIANEANVNVATLSYHFGDKKGLYSAVVEQLLDFDIEVQIGPQDTEEVWIGRMIRVTWRWLEDHREGARLLLRHVLDAGHLEMEHAGDWLAPLTGHFAKNTGMDVEESRLALRSLSILLTRYIIIDDVERMRLTGCIHPDQAKEKLIFHLVNITRRCMMYRKSIEDHLSA